MNKAKSHPELIGRRAELLAELFLQDLDPEFVARPTEDFGYDFFAGFHNSRGGVNIIAIEVKSTERPTSGFIKIKKTAYTRWVNSNIPVLLLVVNVKENDYHVAWPDPEILKQDQESNVVKVHLTKIDDETKVKLRQRLAA